MLDNRLINLKEFNSCASRISKWYDKQSKILNIITNPYNTSLIFINIIKLLLKEDKRILYVFNGESFNKELLDILKEDELSFKYSYMEGNEGNENLVFVNYKNIRNIKVNYDLCIIDDISNYSTLSKEEIREVIEYLYAYSKKIISYSIEKIVNMGITFELSDLIRSEVFVEPRIITTRVKLDQDIPYTLYDYLMWFKNNNRKVIIYVPTEEKINKLYNYYTNDLMIKDVKIYKFFKRDPLKVIDYIYRVKNKSAFVITNNIREYAEYESDIDIVALFADESFYNYKKILYFCADVGKNIKDKNMGEVLLVSKDISEDMDLAKDIMRRYNKNIWEKGLLNY